MKGYNANSSSRGMLKSTSTSHARGSSANNFNGKSK